MTAELVPDRTGPDRPGPAAPGPRFQIVRGDPTDAEVVALVTGLMAVTAEAPQPGWHRPSGWSDRGRALRTGLPHSPDAWRLSLRP
ncbi:MAG: acyl-CoA carboxylase subunit epsilon [Micrococcales bacterium]|nr:acyl-CoA carboxylase subunit epsilon [Micrococcales bacterium]